MGIREQAKYASTPLAQFLDDRLPRHHDVVASWTRTLESMPNDPPSFRGVQDSLGWALELRLGLDLADRPARWQELSYLSVDRCVGLLTAAGFEHTTVGVLPPSGTSDPVLLHWSRTHHPTGIDDVQRAALATCLDLASFSQPMHRWRNTRTVDERRSLFASTVGNDGLGGSTDLLDGLAQAWTAYLDRGREALLGLGDRVVVAPELARGYGVADLVVGNALVDVKLVAEPTVDHVRAWVRQLLGYVLLDRHNALRLDAISVYYGWDAQLLVYPLSELLATTHPGVRLALANLRADFYSVLSNDLDDYAAWKERERYR